MPIVDAQVHIWNEGETLPPHRAQPYSVSQVLADMDEAGIDAAVLHPPRWDPNCNEIAVAAAAAHPGRFAILGNFPLETREGLKLIPGWKSRPGMLGLRFTFLRPDQQTWLSDGTLDWLWPELEAAGLPVALLANPQLPAIGAIAARHPRLRLIVDHMGGAHRQKGAAAMVYLPELEALARHPNIAVKATGGPGYAEDAWPFASLTPWYQRIYAAFGPDRMFWGTDITRMPCSWAQCVAAFRREMAWMPRPDLDRIMGPALCDWIGWRR